MPIIKLQRLCHAVARAVLVAAYEAARAVIGLPPEQEQTR